jgi:hypothetical protein
MLALSPLLLLLLTAPAGSPAPRGGEPPLASIDVIAPEQRSFLLHATIPLPKGELAPGAVESPYAIVSHDAAGTLVPAQVEGVSRYPSGDWDVVQLIARVERGPDESTREPLRFDVVRSPHAPGPSHKPCSILGDLMQPGTGLVLRCRDVWGHQYELDLLARGQQPSAPTWRVRKSGPWLNQFRTAGVLMPRADEYSAQRGGAPLPHMMGALAWFSDWQGEDALGLDLRVHNGLASGARKAQRGEEALGAVYWQSLELCVPRGLVVVPNVADPFFGEPYLDGDSQVYPIVAAYPDGELHMMPPQAQLLRRLVLVREGQEELAKARLEHQGLGFCASSSTAWSFSNPSTARFLSQRDELPSMDYYAWKQAHGKHALRAHESVQLRELRAQLESGAAGPYPRPSAVMGWAHPNFISIEGGVGGEEISLNEGAKAIGAISRENYARLELLHRMNLSRQPQALWDASGAPVGVYEWSVQRDGVATIPFDYRNYGRGVIPRFKYPALGGPPASEQVAEVAARGARPPYDQGTIFEPGGSLPSGDENLVNWLPHDGQHWIRFTKNAKALLWIGDDPVAEDDLELFAELFHLAFHELASPHPPGSRVTLAHSELLAAQHPREGLRVDRETAWGIDAFCAYYSTADDAWRARQRPWIERVADNLLEGAMPSGILIRSDYPPLLQNTRYEGAHAFQSHFLLLAQRMMIESVFGQTDPTRSAQLQGLYLRTIDYLFWGPVWQTVKASWSTDDAPVFETGPRWAFPVARNDGFELPPFSDFRYWGRDYLPGDGFNGGVETSYGYATLSFAADWTQRTHGRGLKNRYLRRSLDYGSGAPNFPALYQRLTSRSAQLEYDKSKDTAGFLARLRRLQKAEGR